MSSTDQVVKQEPDHYTILGVLRPTHRGSPTISNDALKAAYRRRLLQHHPDKALVPPIQDTQKEPADLSDRFTVDQIVEAYETLSNPVSRTAYNEKLYKCHKDAEVSRQVDAKKFAASTSETYDLEDLNYSEDQQSWFKACRCGDMYRVTVTQLEENAADGEILVGCRGCSLNIRVTFQAIE